MCLTIFFNVTDVPCIKEEIHSNGSNDTNINGTNNNLKHKKSELSLLDMYSGCGGMSTGLCFGAKASGVRSVNSKIK